MRLDKSSNASSVDSICSTSVIGSSFDIVKSYCWRRNPRQQFLCISAAVILAAPLVLTSAHAGSIDTDGDGLPDDIDNCPMVSNPLQLDFDQDRMGDACDPDDDGDGINDGLDNCPLSSNPGQADIDGDFVGDTCDNCPMESNPDQYNNDGDDYGDVCDNDDDNDGVDDELDNCKFISNPLQENDDFDAFGNACDAVFNEDGVLLEMMSVVEPAVTAISDANPPGGSGLIAKLMSNGGVLQRASNAVVAMEAGLIDVETYLNQLESALEKLDAFDNQLSAKISNGQIVDPLGVDLEEASEDLRMTIDILILNAGM
jgi:hypothetical protein